MVVEYRYGMIEINAVWCGLECVLWGSEICNLDLNVMFMVECGRDVVVRFDVKCGAMWNVTEMQKVRCGIWRGVECCTMQDVEITMGCEIVMKNVAYAMCCVIVARCQMWKKMQCVTTVRCGGIM